MTYHEWVSLIAITRQYADFLAEMVPDDESAASLSAQLKDWAAAQERWVNQKLAEEGLW